MILHENLFNLLEKLNIKDVNQTAVWLVASYFNLDAPISKEDLNHLLEAKWVERGVEENSIKVLFDLFNAEKLEDKVDEYLKLFKKYGKFGSHQAVKNRLKEVYKKFGYDMDTILKLAKYHLETQGKYARQPHYFLKKGAGSSLVYPIQETALEMNSTKSYDDDDLLN